MRPSAIAFVVAAASFVARPVAAQPKPFEWRGTLGEGQTLEVKGVNGHIHAAAASSAEAAVTATKSARRSNPDDVRIEVVPHAGGVTICAVYPDVPGEASNRCEPGPGDHSQTRNNDTTVDFELRVPADVKLVARTVNGGVEAESLASDVDARAVNGAINVSTTGTAIGTTVNGSVNISMGRAEWPAGAKLATVNGAITVRLPQALNAEVSASTVNGSIVSDFPITVTGVINRRRLKGTIGRGGQELALSTVNGSITLLTAQ